MALTAAQLETRRRYLGSSEVAAALGLDPYRSKHDLYLEKTGRAAPFAGNEHTERGQKIEPVLLTWAETKFGKLEYPDTLIDGNRCYNPDAIVAGKREGIEAKTGVESDEWGDPESAPDGIPERYLVQCIQGMTIAKLDVMHVPVVLAGYRQWKWHLYRVPFVRELADVIAVEGERFMIEHVQRDTPPEDSRPSIEVLKRVRRQPEKVVPISGQLIDGLIVMRAAKKQACEQCEEAERAVVEALGDAEAGESKDGRLVTYFSTARKGYTVEPTTFRSLRVKKGNNGAA